MKRKNDQGTSSKGKHLIEPCLQLELRFNPLSSWQETWQRADRHSLGEGDENSNLDSKAARRSLSSASSQEDGLSFALVGA